MRDFFLNVIYYARQSRSQLDRPDRILIGRHLSLEDTFCVCRALFFPLNPVFCVSTVFHFLSRSFLWINHSRRSFVSSVFCRNFQMLIPNTWKYGMRHECSEITTIIYKVAYFTSRIKITSVQQFVLSVDTRCCCHTSVLAPFAFLTRSNSSPWRSMALMSGCFNNSGRFPSPPLIYHTLIVTRGVVFPICTKKERF